MGNSVVYLISLRRKYNPNLTFSYGYFLIPIMDLVLCLASPIGGIIEDKIGGKKNNLFININYVCFILTYVFLQKYFF
jgi:nitrate/nitrite transporter NarK